MSLDWLKGLTTSPWLVGLMRGVLSAIGTALVVYGIAWLGGPDLPAELKPWAPVLVLVLRSIEGWLDQAGKGTPA